MLKNKKGLLLLTILLLVFSPLFSMMAGAASGEAEKPPLIRIDRDDRNAWEKPLDNLRIITDHRYQFKKSSSKDDIDPDTPVLAPGLYSASTGKRVPFTDDYTIVEKAGRKTA